MSELLYGSTTWTTNETPGVKMRWGLYEDGTCRFEQILEATL